MCHVRVNGWAIRHHSNACYNSKPNYLTPSVIEATQYRYTHWLNLFDLTRE